MPRRCLSIVLILTILVSSSGCTVTKTKKIPKDELIRIKKDTYTALNITYAVLVSGETIRFDSARYSSFREQIIGTTPSGEKEIDIDEVLYVVVRYETPSGGRTILLVAAIGLVVLLIFAAVAASQESNDPAPGTSCPLIYSFDGEKYVFDGEPLGGAICRGLARGDLSRLDHLRAVDGKYELLVRNQPVETQYIDELKLVVVDHPLDTEVVPDLEGRMQTVAGMVTPSRAYDEKGADISGFINKRDQIAWQTHLPRDDSFREGTMRHNLTFEFPKPPDATTARLIVNAGTASWGSYMIKEMLKLRGDKLDDWYAGINSGGPELAELYQFMDREELFTLKLRVQEGDSWGLQGYIPGGGPLVTEDRVIPLDLGNVTGDRVTIELNPPMGYWSVDYLALDYGDQPESEATTVTAAQAVDQSGTDITTVLMARDDDMHVMPMAGDWVSLTFDVPPQPAGTRRSVFLETYGYYKIHTPKGLPEQSALITALSETNGGIVEYSMDEYLKLRSRLLSSN